MPTAVFPSSPSTANFLQAFLTSEKVKWLVERVSFQLVAEGFRVGVFLH